jgi:hypothetical protein
MHASLQQIFGKAKPGMKSRTIWANVDDERSDLNSGFPKKFSSDIFESDTCWSVAITLLQL